MATGNAVAPVIIKRKKVVGGGGHHGGAWKVAYADFVTAMMAFFMLMWLLNATTEKQRKGIADYFNPNIPINRISGGGEGAFGGDSIFSENTLARSGTGASGVQPPWTTGDESSPSTTSSAHEKEALLEELNATLIGGGGESDLIENTLRHIVTRLSDEGVVIEMFELPGRPLFDAKHRPLPILNRLLNRVARIASSVENNLAIKAHVSKRPVVLTDKDTWRPSIEHSLTVRRGLVASGIQEVRFDRIAGEADTKIVTNDPLSVRNNRIEIVFLVKE